MAAMQAASLEILEKANVPPGQARAIVQAIEIEIAGANETHATKTDLQLLRFETREDFQSLRHELATFREETKHERASEIGKLRQEITEMRWSLDVKIEGLGKEMHSIARDNLRTMTAITIGSMTSVLAVVLGVVYFLFAHGAH